MAQDKTDAKGDEKIILEARKYLKECVEHEEDERKLMQDDLRFCTLDQWPQEIRNERENDIENGPRPCLTIDKINQFITQVTNDMRQGKPGIVVRPQDEQADVETAKILKGLVRNIEDQSNADIAYYMAGESAAKIGLGFFRITTEYVSDDSFDQEIFVRPIPNTFSVYLGKHQFPDGSDAKRGYIVDVMPIDRFKREYPNAKTEGADDWDSLQDDVGYWRGSEETETMTVVEYFYLERIDQTLYFLADGTTITKKDYDSWPDEAGVKPTIMEEREGHKEQLKWVKMTGIEVLDKRDLPGQYIPIVEVVGRESVIDGKRRLWGLVRPAKDSLRMYNYFASTITEKIALAPKMPFIGAVGQFATMGEKWKKANRVNFAYLEYDPVDVNGNAIPGPQRQGPSPVEVALVNQMQTIEHDVQTSLGMFKAAVGETESQQSGRAILALQRESDTGTYHFGANLGMSIRHAGRVIVDLIPHYYDTRRVVRILGEDGTVQSAQIDPNQPQAMTQQQGMDGKVQSIYNPGVGKYDVSITVGPSYNTKRMEAAATLTEIVKSNPEMMPIVGDLLFRSLDFPHADQIAERLKKMLPPNLQEDDGAPIPAKAAAKIQELMQAGQQLQEQLQQVGEENMKLKSGAEAQMAKVQVSAQESQIELQLQKAKQDSELQLAREKAAAEIEIKRQVADADYSIAQRKLEQEQEKENFKRESETMEKVRLANEVEAESVGPQVVEAMKNIVAEMQAMEQRAMAAQQQNQEFLQAVVAEIGKPKSVAIGGIQRDAQGGIRGAKVTVQ